MPGPTSASSSSNTLGDIRKYILKRKQSCRNSLTRQWYSRVAVASELYHVPILTVPAAFVVQFFNDFDYQMAWSNDYSCQVEGVAKSSMSTSVDARLRP